jgi:hypothetical protein
LIVEEEQREIATAGCGEFLIKGLAERLMKDFGTGFNVSNLKYFRQFYLPFSIGRQCMANLQILGRLIIRSLHAD